MYVFLKMPMYGVFILPNLSGRHWKVGVRTEK